MPKVFCLFLLLLCAGWGYSQDLNIGIFSNLQFSRATLTARGDYDVYCNKNKIATLHSQQSVGLANANGKLQITVAGKTMVAEGTILVVPRKSNTQFQLQPLGAKTNGHVYEGYLKVLPVPGGLRCINVIDLEHYVAGVIEAEAGGGELFEYYKVQAIISRTYALNNRRRHEAEGFELCDGTHCQVYHGMPRREDLAIAAAADTRELVIVDSDINLITAAFHSNCGGQTVNASDVWSKSVPYLVSRPDSFCIAMPSSKWEKCFSMEEWDHYLEKKARYMDADTEAFSPSRSYYQVDNCLYVSTLSMRQDLKLRSTLFDVRPTGDKIQLMGRGFGHGVGLCQEGAMQMAKHDYSYQDIIHYYYKDVHIIPLRRLDFFRDVTINEE